MKSNVLSRRKSEQQLDPQKSRVLLQLCLTPGMDRNAVQEAFFRY